MHPIQIGAVQLIACDSHVHLVSKAGSVIGENLHQLVSAVVHGQARQYRIQHRR